VAREGEGSFKWFLIASPGACLLLLLGGKPLLVVGFAGLLLAYGSDLFGNPVGYTRASLGLPTALLSHIVRHLLSCHTESLRGCGCPCLG